MKLTPVQKRAARLARNHSGLDMNLVALIDIFTILIFFLMSSTGIETLTNARAVKLPSSVAEKAPRQTLVVSVSETDIVVEGHKVADVSEVLQLDGDLIPGLKQELDVLAARPGLRAWAADILARAGASCGANLDAGEALDGPQQRAGNDEWPRKSPRPEGLAPEGGRFGVAPLVRGATPDGAPRLASPPFRDQRGPGCLPPTLYADKDNSRQAVTVMGDKRIPYRLLRKVMATAAQAGFVEVAFAVQRKT